MKAEAESIVCNRADEIPHNLVRIINAITLSANEEELRAAVKRIAEETDLDKFFAYDYGTHHFWLTHRRLSNGEPREHRLLKENIGELKQQLLNHEYFDTELLFVSPSGNGLKWIIPVDLKGREHSRYFKAVANCIKAAGLPLVDMSGSDVARSCFLPYAPQANINHKYKK